MSGQLSLDGFDQGPQPLFNLFFALQPDSRARLQAKTLAQQLAGAQGIQIKEDRVQRFHVTLFHVGHFQGEIPSGVMADAKRAVQDWGAAPFRITFDKVASFSGRSDNLPIVLRGAESSPELMQFQSNLDDRLKRAGLVHGESRRPFTPHLTLFYGRKPVKETSIDPITWQVEDFVLISSVFGAGSHEEQARWPLLASPA